LVDLLPGFDKMDPEEHHEGQLKVESGHLASGVVEVSTVMRHVV